MYKLIYKYLLYYQYFLFLINFLQKKLECFRFDCNNGEVCPRAVSYNCFPALC